MKKKLLNVLAISMLSLASATSFGQFVDLTTGKKAVLVKHQGNGMMYNTETQRPVNIYVDPSTNDTFYGRTGANINGQVTRANGRYSYNGDTYVYKSGEFTPRTEADNEGYRKVFQGDGDVKVKYGDYKRKEKIDGDVKVKDGEAKMKSEPDGSLKVKDSGYKKKIDDAGNILEKDDSTKIKLNADGSVKVKDKTVDYKGKIDENGDVKEKDGKTKRKLKREDKLKIKNEEGKVKVTEEGVKVKPND
jgi:hypothetical protein